MSALGLEVWRLRSIPGVADLYAAERREDPTRRVEFIDALDPGIPRERKWVGMVSTQFGCCVGCAMCDAGERRFRGNVPTEDLLEQVRRILGAHPEVDPRSVAMFKLHFARMGEPTFNPGVLEAIETLARGRALPGLVPSLSTVAPDCPVSVDFLEELRRIKNRLFKAGRFQLQFSVHTTDPVQRRALIPIRTWGLERMGEFARRWVLPGDRKVTLNFVSSPDLIVDPEALARACDPASTLVKLTPTHPTKRGARNGLTDDWHEPPARVSERARAFEARGFQVIVNAPWPAETAGGVSCGQVAASVAAFPAAA